MGKLEGTINNYDPKRRGGFIEAKAPNGAEVFFMFYDYDFCSAGTPVSPGAAVRFTAHYGSLGAQALEIEKVV